MLQKHDLREIIHTVVIEIALGNLAQLSVILYLLHEFGLLILDFDIVPNLTNEETGSKLSKQIFELILDIVPLILAWPCDKLLNLLYQIIKQSYTLSFLFCTLNLSTLFFRGLMFKIFTILA